MAVLNNLDITDTYIIDENNGLELQQLSFDRLIIMKMCTLHEKDFTKNI